MTNLSWWNMSAQEVLKSWAATADKGLSSHQVRDRQQRYRNVLEEGKKISSGRIILSQFTDTMVLVLLAATAISGIIGAMFDAITIMTIVVLNAILGFIQEYKAERSLEEIRKMASPFAVVIRDGQRLNIAAAELVPGDVVLIEAGDKVPADIRLLQSFSLETDESALTGESMPAEKNAAVICPGNCPLAERTNMAFMGTAVTRGRAKGVVIGTGMSTIMGEIADMMKETETEMTPLQLKLDGLGKVLIVICLVVCAVVVGLGIARGEDIMTMFMAGISLAVAAIPEGLPAIVTVVLALGVQRMAKRNAIVRKLPAVETLGCTTVICSDKTGTLTRNQMTAKKVASFDNIFDIEGDGYKPVGRLINQQGKSVSTDKAVGTMMEIAINCNNSTLKKVGGSYEVQGDPTEGALLVMAVKAGHNQKKKALQEIPFDSERKKMSAIVDDNGPRLLTKGALDVIIDSCAYVMKDGRVSRISAAEKRYFMQLQETWATSALRVLGFAYKDLPRGKWQGLSESQLESELILVGMCGIMDPPRPGAAKSVRTCLAAGIVPIMITGDHPRTAVAIANQIGISNHLEVITGTDIDQLEDEQLYKKAMQARVFARVFCFVRYAAFATA